MKYLTIVTLFFALLNTSCNNPQKKDTNENTGISTEQFYLNIGGEQQYVEILSSSEDNPILLFVHGGPAWPQTPQLRYFNSEIADNYTLVIWEQRGAGKSYEINPKPQNLTLNQIVKDGIELTQWLKNKYNEDKIFLAGYSWGSLVGVKMAEQRPEDYHAYIGIAQFINKPEGMRITQAWLKERALETNNTLALNKLDSLKNPSFYKDENDRFFEQYLLVNEFGGAVHNTKAIPEVEKAQMKYDDYKNYDWYGVWEASAKILQNEFYDIDVRNITQLEVPVFLFEGRHDWNVPAVLAEAWLNELTAPKKEIIWFDNSGHGPLEEEPIRFNKEIINILNAAK